MNRNAALNILRRQATFLLACIKMEKVVKATSWQGAVPGTPEGQAAFVEYCRSKARLSARRREPNVVNNTIRFIKKNVK